MFKRTVTTGSLRHESRQTVVMVNLPKMTIIPLTLYKDSQVWNVRADNLTLLTLPWNDFSNWIIIGTLSEDNVVINDEMSWTLNQQCHLKWGFVTSIWTVSQIVQASCHFRNIKIGNLKRCCLNLFWVKTVNSRCNTGFPFRDTTSALLKINREKVTLKYKLMKRFLYN